ncbi:hypothetical protein TWF506_004725 [Arthrobotrys conoides]|uniref:F-box domain-containing protein n=1 Tax=Arthrobotrys conoides TaxID=74498 RepID=A0AAN8P3I7_9PEZI
MSALLLLPPELILEILTFIDAFTALHTLRRTSRRLRTLTDAVYSTMHGLPIGVWIKVIHYLPITSLPQLRKTSHPFHNLFTFLISQERLPHTYYGRTPVSPDIIYGTRSYQLRMNPFLLHIRFWYKHWRRFGGRKSITTTPSLLFESPSHLPVDRMVVSLTHYRRFQNTESTYFEKVVLRKKRCSRIITNLDVLVAVDEMLGQGLNEVYVQVRDGILCISKTVEEFGRHIGKVYLGGVDESIGFIDDLIHEKDFLGSAGRSREVYGTTGAEYWSLDTTEGRWKAKDVWLVIHVRRMDARRMDVS